MNRHLQLPKHYLKSKSFQDECFHSVVEQLSLHFSQWSFHISFPDLATIPLIRLKRINEIPTTETLRRMVKRLIDQVLLASISSQATAYCSHFYVVSLDHVKLIVRAIIGRQKLHVDDGAMSTKSGGKTLHPKHGHFY